jgi:diguanylate cyclase (GGDEF)-like protein
VLLASGFALDVSAGVRLLAVASILINLLVVWRAVLLIEVVRAQKDELAALARTDALTGIPNRRSWDFELARAAARARSTSTTLTVAIFDLDHFKDYNDEHGHQHGDQVLIDCAAAWTAALPPEGYLARYGGEEFTVLLPDHQPDAASAILDRLRASTPEPVTVSIGAAALTGTESPKAAVAAADEALYAAKALGRNQVAWRPASLAVVGHD